MDHDPPRPSQPDATFAGGIDIRADGQNGFPQAATPSCSLIGLMRAGGATISKLQKRSVIANEGASQQKLTAVLNGLVKVSTSLHDGRTQILSLRFPGEFISLRTQNDPWSANVEAVEDVTLLTLSASRTALLRSENPQFNIEISLHASREIARAQAHILTLGRRLPIERLAALLIEFSDCGLADGAGSGQVRVPLSRDEIADYIGLKSETVSRQFTRLKSSGFIQLIAPSRILVHNWDALRRLSNGENPAFGIEKGPVARDFRPGCASGNRNH